MKGEAQTHPVGSHCPQGGPKTERAPTKPPPGTAAAPLFAIAKAEGLGAGPRGAEPSPAGSTQPRAHLTATLTQLSGAAMAPPLARSIRGPGGRGPGAGPGQVRGGAKGDTPTRAGLREGGRGA